MSKCCVVGCDNRRGEKNSKYFYKFPKNLPLRQAWTLAIRRQSFTPTCRSVVCGDHFEKACFLKDCTLIDDAVPTMFPTHKAICEIIKIPVEENVAESPEELAKLSVEIASSINKTSPDVSDAHVEFLNNQLKSLDAENACSKRKLKSLQQKYRRCSRRIAAFEQFINSFRKNELIDDKSLELLKAIPSLDNELLQLQLCIEQDLSYTLPSDNVIEYLSDSNSEEL